MKKSKRRIRDSKTKTRLSSFPDRHDERPSRPLLTGKSLLDESTDAAKKFAWAACGLLLAFGIFQSVLYFGHQLIPNPDFMAFIKTGHDLWGFQAPTSYTRAPVLGLLQAALSHPVAGPTPDLTAGWLLNAILYPLNLILLWRVGKKIIGPAAIWPAILVAINPWCISMLVDPIIETTLVFFSLLTFYFIFQHSSWCYLFASLTMMVRYEGAALILAAFVVDMITRPGKKQRLRAFLFSVVASLPLIVWLLASQIQAGTLDKHFYLSAFKKDFSKIFLEPIEDRTGIGMHMGLLWRVGFSSLLVPFSGSGQIVAAICQTASQWIVAVTFFFGSIYGIYKHNWNILALLLFLVPYFLVHAFYPFPALRYHVNSYWMVLWISLFAAQALWQLIKTRFAVPAAAIIAMQVSVAIIAGLWFVSLISYLPKLAQISPVSQALPYVAMLLVLLLFALHMYRTRFRRGLSAVTVVLLMGLFITCNQFTLVRLVGTGQREVEFKLLALWYNDNAQAGEKITCYNYRVPTLYTPDHAEYFVSPPIAPTPADFALACQENDITYVAWASREGLKKHHEGYRRFKLHKSIAPLARPQSYGPFQYLATVGNRNGFINIFRLKHLPDTKKTDTP